MKYLPILITIFVLFFIIGVYFVTKINTETNYAELHNNYESLRIKEANFHDAMWKTISGIAQVDKMNDTMQTKLFNTWETAISKTANLGELSQGSFFPMMFQQAGLTYDNTIKLKLVQAIDDKNSEFIFVRDAIAASCLELNNFVTNGWNKFFLPSDIKKIDCITITSTRTQNASKTGVDDNSTIY